MSEELKLRQERRVFERYREDWSRTKAGKFVVIQDEIVAGFYDNYAEAMRAGLSRFGVAREFLVKQIWIKEPVYLVS